MNTLAQRSFSLQTTVDFLSLAKLSRAFWVALCTLLLLAGPLALGAGFAILKVAFYFEPAAYRGLIALVGVLTVLWAAWYIYSVLAFLDETFNALAKPRD